MDRYSYILLFLISNGAAKSFLFMFHPGAMFTCNRTSHSPSNYEFILKFCMTIDRRIIINNSDCRGSVLEGNVAVGRGTTIGEKTLITRSVIEKRCTIGNDARVTDAYIWDNVVIKVN